MMDPIIPSFGQLFIGCWIKRVDDCYNVDHVRKFSWIFVAKAAQLW